MSKKSVKASLSRARGPAAQVAAGALILAGVLALSCSVAPPFDLDAAKDEIARAFDRTPAEVGLFDHHVAEPGASWLVEFRLDGHPTNLEARFVLEDRRWLIETVRERRRGDADPAWDEVGILIGRVKAEMANRAELTMRRMEELAQLVERYAAARDNRYPTVALPDLKRLILDRGYTTEWAYDTDGWGQPLVYHAAPDGLSYILLSPGADGTLDRDLQAYFDNTDRGIEIYDGPTSDPRRDIIFTTGAFAQKFVPAP